MSMHTFPFLYINLGGEMLYILKQRLEAQNVSLEKKARVIKDICGHMLGERITSSLFSPQPLASYKRLKSNFTKLAHASIMKLNSDSMDKLFDLMIMAVKYQIMLCKSGRELLLLTLNHLDGIRHMIDDDDDHARLINSVLTRFVGLYDRLSQAQLMVIRQTLLMFFQDYHKKVSIFLTLNIQHSSGHFILPSGGPLPYNAHPPGKIIYRHGNKRTETFHPPALYSYVEEEGSLEIIGDRVTTLGHNLYVRGSEEEGAAAKNIAKHKQTTQDVGMTTAKAELDLLHNLLIGFKPASAPDFKLNIFEDEDDTLVTTKPTKLTSLAPINITKNPKGQVKHIMEEFASLSTTQDDSDDLLSLMDAL